MSPMSMGQVPCKSLESGTNWDPMGRKGEPIQAYFRDIVGSVPDHCNKASIPIKGGVIFLLVLPSICKKKCFIGEAQKVQ